MPLIKDIKAYGGVEVVRRGHTKVVELDLDEIVDLKTARTFLEQWGQENLFWQWAGTACAEECNIVLQVTLDNDVEGSLGYKDFLTFLQRLEYLLIGHFEEGDVENLDLYAEHDQVKPPNEDPEAEHLHPFE